MTNYEWLLNMDGEERQAWFDAEHESCGQYADQQKREHVQEMHKLDSREKPYATLTSDGVYVTRDDGSTVALCEAGDSREKLEAEIRGKVAYGTSTLLYPPSANKVTQYLPSLSLDTVLGWLDRQAAITAQEYRDNFTGFGLLHDLNESGISVKYLPAERHFVFDDHALVGCQAQVDSLQAELDKWHKLAEGIVLPDYPMTQYQPNSRADLEAEVHHWLTSHVAVSVNVGEIEAEVMKWLDTAADIARREQGESFKSYYARKMALHGCGGADDRINELEAECLYWKGQMLKSLECATENYAEGVMAYPRPDGYTEPSLLVNDEMNCLRDFHADDQMLIAKLEAENAELREDAHKYRTLAGDLLDAAQNMQRIADRGLE